MKNRFFRCKHCGNIVGLVHNGGVPLMCCGEKMELLEAGVVEASLEKHVPMVKVEDNIVKVDIGSVAHPMTEEHNISWVYLQTDRGGQRKSLIVGKDPYVEFALCDEQPVAVFAYCNLHGLWVKEL